MRLWSKQSLTCKPGASREDAKYDKEPMEPMMRGLLFPINSYQQLLPVVGYCGMQDARVATPLVSLTVPCSWHGCSFILGFADRRDTLTRLHSEECHSSAINETVPSCYMLGAAQCNRYFLQTHQTPRWGSLVHQNVHRTSSIS